MVSLSMWTRAAPDFGAFSNLEGGLSEDGQTVWLSGGHGRHHRTVRQSLADLMKQDSYDAALGMLAKLKEACA